MSDDSVGKLCREMLDQTRAWRELYRNQQELILGLNTLLHTHSETLRMHQKAIEILCREAGIAFVSDDPPPTPPTELN